MTHRTNVVSFVLAVIAVPCCFAHNGAPEVIFGRNVDGRLVADTGFAMPHKLPSSLFSAYPGFTDPFPGFESLDFDVPAEGLFTLSPGAQIEVILVSMDPGVRMLNDTGSGFLAVGETYFFGSPFFDFHPLWQVPHGYNGQVFSATFIARDRSGTHADSEPFTLTLTPAPCPGDFNGDAKVNTPDLVYFLGRFGGAPVSGEPWGGGDLNNDGAVDTQDLVAFLARFGKRCT